jgi:hypothetical protein
MTLAVSALPLEYTLVTIDGRVGIVFLAVLVALASAKLARMLTVHQRATRRVLRVIEGGAASSPRAA